MTDEPVRQSMLGWIVSSLGFPYIFLLPLAGLMSFLLTLFIVWRGKGPMAGPALLMIVHTPFFIGLFAALQGAIASYTIIATSASTPKPSDLAQGISTALIAPMVALLLMAPGYAIAAFGAFIRCIGARDETGSR